MGLSRLGLASKEQGNNNSEMLAKVAHLIDEEALDLPVGEVEEFREAARDILGLMDQIVQDTEEKDKKVMKENERVWEEKNKEKQEKIKKKREEAKKKKENLERDKQERAKGINKKKKNGNGQAN